MKDTEKDGEFYLKINLATRKYTCNFHMEEDQDIELTIEDKLAYKISNGNTADN